MPDIFLIVSILVGFFILLIVGFYMLVHYQHPDDHNDAYFPKFVVGFGFGVAGATVLLLPLDVANREGFPGAFRFCCVRVRACHDCAVDGDPRA